MKVGSLVVIKPLRLENWNLKKLGITWTPVDDEETIYTVRGFDYRGFDYKGGDIGVFLEEGCIGYDENGEEWSLVMRYVKEVQPPMEISIESLIGELV